MSSASLNTAIHDHNSHESNKIIQLVDALVAHMATPHAGPNLRRRCLRILASRLAVPSNQNEVCISDSIKKYLIRTHQSNDRALNCALVLQKLNTSTALNRKWATLYFLYAVSLQVANADDSAAEIPIASFTQAPLQHSRLLDAQRDSGIAPSLAHQRSTMFSMNSTRINESTDFVPIMERPSTGFETYLTTENTSYQVPEQTLLKDVLFALQGIDGRFIKWDASQSQYILDPTVGIPRPVRDMIHRISELGYLYRSITEYLAEAKSAKDRGSVEQSFAWALQGEITQYFRLLTIIETSIGKDEMTLRRLYMWSVDPAQRLRVMVAMIVSAKGVHGGALIGMVHTYAHHGDPALEGFVQHVLRIMCMPVFGMIKRWVFEGELIDVHGEFFVKESDLLQDQEWWRCKYTLNNDMVPGFIHQPLANKILLIGKTLNYLRFQANDSQWVSDRVHVGLSTEGLEYGDVCVFEGVIDAAFNVTTNRLVTILFDQFHLFDHLLALKRYMLMEQGDFIQCLMEGLAPTLNKPANLLYRHEFVGILEQAIRSSNVQHASGNVIERVDVRLLHSSASEIGWDVFSLDYQVDSPLDAIVTKSCMKTYIQLFGFLWQVKRVSNVLIRGWKPTSVLESMLTDTALVTAQHQCHRQWAEAMYFINQYQYYLMYEVIECAWLEFQSSLAALRSGTRPTKQAITDLDGLINAHHLYLNHISSRVTIPGTHAFENIKLILECVHQLEAARIKLDDQIVVAGRHSASFDAHRRGVEDVIMQLDACDDIFKKQVAELLVVLANSNDETLRNLKARLNFNEYYGSDEVLAFGI